MSKTYHDSNYLKIETTEACSILISEKITDQKILLVEDDIPHIIAALTGIQQDVKQARRVQQDKMKMVTWHESSN